MNIDGLKPCPFCGGEPMYDETYGIGSVFCTKCGAESPAGFTGNGKKENAIKQWNTRVAGWIKTSERLPEQKTRVLISNGKSCDIGQLHEDWLDNTLRRFWSVEGAENLGEDLMTYWMPLPEPPEVEE